MSRSSFRSLGRPRLLLGLALMLVINSVEAGDGKGPRNGDGPNEIKEMTFFDPRVASDIIIYRDVEHRVIVDGDIDLGTVDDVRRESLASAIYTAKEVQRLAAVYGQLNDNDRQKIDDLALKSVAEETVGQDQVLAAITALAPLKSMRDNLVKQGNQRQAATVFQGAMSNYRWKGGKIHFVIDDEFNKVRHQGLKQNILSAVQHWNQMTTHIQLIPCSTDKNVPPDHVKFVIAGGLYCYSECVGRRPTGGQQRIGLPPRCETPQIIHEIGHVVGLFHEHNRHDRDQYITIHAEHMMDAGNRQFDSLPLAVGQDFGPFDFQSIMLYPSKAFSRDGQRTMTAKRNSANMPDPPRDEDWGLKTVGRGGSTIGLSAGDLAAVQMMYGP